MAATHGTVVRIRVALIALGIHGVLAAACSPDSFPPGPAFLLEGPRVVDSSSDSGGTSFVVTATDDNPQLAGYAFLQDFQEVSSDSTPGFICDPFGVDLSAFPGVPLTGFQACGQTYRMGATQGFDWISLRHADDRFPFHAGMVAIDSFTDPEAVFVQAFRSEGFPFIWSAGCASSAQSDLCANSTFPIAFPSVTLPQRLDGTIQPLRVRIERVSNDQPTTIAGDLTILPPPGLLVVPVHVHILSNDRDANSRIAKANGFVPFFDELGAVRSSHSTSPQDDTTTVTLTRSLTSELTRSNTERAFIDCNVQLRLKTVQFHPLPSSLLVNGALRPNCGGCGPRDCASVISDNPASDPSRGPFSPLGHLLTEFFERTFPPEFEISQGIHILPVEEVTDSFGNYVGDGYACSMSSNGSPVPPFAFVDDRVRDIDIHEIAHVLGLNETQVDRGLQEGFSEQECAIVRSHAAAIIALPE